MKKKLIDELSINSIRILGLDMVQKANSGHPGIVLGLAPTIYTIYKDFLNFSPKNPNWINRDRFVLSAGHGSALLYSVLHHFNYKFTIDDLKKFRQVGSITPGHPEYDVNLGIECTTGPLGQGIGLAVGMAIGLKNANSIYNNNYCEMFNGNVFVACGDGCLQEGISYEACSLAGHLKLSNLILIHDSNSIQLDSKVSATFSENLHQRFKAMNWYTQKVFNGNDLDEIKKAIQNAIDSSLPSYIEVVSTIGYKSPLENTTKVHGAPLSVKDYLETKKNYDWNYQPFTVPEEVKQNFYSIIKDKVLNYEKFKTKFEKFSKKNPEISKEILNFYNHKKLSIDWNKINELFISNNSEATRVSVGKIWDYICQNEKIFLGGSADLSVSTKIAGADGQFNCWNYNGRTLYFGVRDFGLASFVSGITLTSIKWGYGGDFFAFSNYMKAPIRLACQMQIPLLLFFSHDSVLLGEDGPTHQPVEQIWDLRNTHNLYTYRPADIKESIGCLKDALEKNLSSVSCFVTSRQNLPQLSHTSVEKTQKGGYILVNFEPEDNRKKLIFLATGSEVSLAILVAEALKNDFNIRVVSLPCVEKFLENSKIYLNSVLSDTEPLITFELSNKNCWNIFGNQRIVYSFGLSTFGVSGKDKDIQKYFELDQESIVKNIKKTFS
ncbi:transketolase [symbiont of Argiope bruennichi]|uniref:transketolase family protein n=1 Tax=symbiont of Argiope bruennichi TaxID=2810479 RepID=UPI003DA54A35